TSILTATAVPCRLATPSSSSRLRTVLCSGIDRFSPLITISISIGDYSPKKKPQRLACGHLSCNLASCTVPTYLRYEVDGASLPWYYPGQVLRVVTTVTAARGHSQHLTPLACR